MRTELNLTELISELEERQQFVKQMAANQAELLYELHPSYRASARNLIHYLALRSTKLRRIQGLLANLGLSSLSQSEGYALADMTNILYMLHSLNGTEESFKPSSADRRYSYFRSRDEMKKNKRLVFGQSSRPSLSHIMVTMPEEASRNTDLIISLLKGGMDVARINCSHDSLSVWKKMVANIRIAESKTEKKCLIYMDLAGPKLRTGPVKGWKIAGKNNKVADFLSLVGGDLLELHKKPIEGSPALIDGEGKMTNPAKISVSLPEIFRDVQAGHRIWFDDGKIGGIIKEAGPDKILVQIVNAHLAGSKLRGEKGVNLPDTDLQIHSLTKQDLKNLPFITSHADMIGYSFVRKPQDIAFLRAELKKLGKEDIGIILKIETRESFDHLPSLLLEAMKSPKVGVMLARGDLAVELGFERVAEVQEEILLLCEAAHVPVIWATQVLDRLAKKGLATRAEVTDAAMSGRAQCVMLNKGPFILNAVSTLDNILSRMVNHQMKKKGSLRKLQVAERFFAQSKPPKKTSKTKQGKK